MKTAGSRGMKNLDRFIENPEAVAPNNAMKPFAGFARTPLRVEIVSYLEGRRRR